MPGAFDFNLTICIHYSTVYLYIYLTFIFIYLFFIRKHIQKDNITFHPNNTVSYMEYRRYYFEPSMSAGNESDVVTIPNMLVLVSHYFPSLITLVNSLSESFTSHSHLCFQGAAVMMEKFSFAVRIMISATFKTFKEGPFLTKTVGELMWGYDSKLVEFLNKYMPGMLPSSGKFGLFAEVSS